jgi:DnaJ-class molecular chaperone
VTIKECTKDGQMYRIRGKGFKFVNQIGDLYIKVNMVTPNSLSVEDRKILNNLKKSKTFK